MGRGPSYPFVDLEEAIGLTRKVYDFTKRSAAPIDSVIKDAWDASPTSSSSQKQMAALKYFGLIEESSNGSGNSIKLTERAVRIILDDPGSAERLQAIKEAALSPKWYRYCWETWGAEMPPSMRSNLLIDHHFVDTTIDGFLRDYKKTVEFAKLSVPEVTSDPPKQESAENSVFAFKIGDYVQWESKGVLRLPEAKRLTGFSDDKQWAFLDGSQTGVPVDQLISAERPAIKPKEQSSSLKTPEILHKGTKMRQEVFTLDEGDVTIHFPAGLSQDSFKDFVDWLEILKRKIGRSVSRPDPPKVDGDTESSGAI